mmetsp:Transcript_38099/g.113779  ORF Transcript_38099/g.113779 Transcript_38099/m.113779 type:complete len:333 (+) Transcript_38099:296-1294(+)
MHVAGNDEVNAVGLCHSLPEGPPIVGREVRHHNLPVRPGLIEVVLQPYLLLVPEPSKPRQTLGDVLRALHPTSRLLRVVLSAADVVLGVGVGFLCVEVVGVQEEIVDGEAWVADRHRPVLSRHHPAAARAPRVADKLVPTAVEAEASVVVVAEDAQPGLPVQALALVDLLKVPLKLPGGDDGLRGSPTVGVDTTPVKVVTAVENVVGAPYSGPAGHLIGHALLRVVVHALDKELLWPLACRVGTILPEHAAPICDDVHKVRAVRSEADVRQDDTVQRRGQIGRRWRLELRRAVPAKARVTRPTPIGSSQLALHLLQALEHLPLLYDGCRGPC